MTCAELTAAVPSVILVNAGDACKAMATAVLYARQLTKDHIYADLYREMFHGYRKREFGAGPAHRYTRAWTEEYGWMSNTSNRGSTRQKTAICCAMTC